MFLCRLTCDVFFGRLLSQAADHRAVKPQISQFAVRQVRQFVNCLAIDAILDEPGLCRLEQRSQASCRCAFERGVMRCCGHLLYSMYSLLPVLSGACLRLKISKCCNCTIPDNVNAAMQQVHRYQMVVDEGWEGPVK